MEREKLNEILRKHERWLGNKEDGERANLEGANLRNAYLESTNLRGAILREADLRSAFMIGTDLRGACLEGANLEGAILIGADLRGAYLRSADLRDANLRDASIRGVVWDDNTKGLDEILTRYFPIACPEYGEFIGWKKTRDDLIVKLKITENAKRSSTLGRKCRCSEAVVLAIENIDGTPSDETIALSYFNRQFIYRVGETVRVPDFDEDRKHECASGIHFFITRQEAVDYGT